jgi:hypothetical protein
MSESLTESISGRSRCRMFCHRKVDCRLSPRYHAGSDSSLEMSQPQFLPIVRGGMTAFKQHGGYFSASISALDRISNGVVPVETEVKGCSGGQT